MTTVSATVKITNADYETLASLADITLTSGKTYSVQIQGLINWKEANAEFLFRDKDFVFTQGDDDVYVRVLASGRDATIVILENA